MNKNILYAVIALLVVALVGLNVVQPMIARNKAKVAAAGLHDLALQIKGQDKASQALAMNQYFASHPVKRADGTALAVAASCDQIIDWMVSVQNENVIFVAWNNRPLGNAGVGVTEDDMALIMDSLANQWLAQGCND